MIKLPKLKPGQPVCVLWRDACSNPGWLTQAAVEEWCENPAFITSVGMYLNHDKINLHLVQSASQGGARLAEILEIPLSIIDKLQKLK